jgi:hypothetical protein
MVPQPNAVTNVAPSTTKIFANINEVWSIRH